MDQQAIIDDLRKQLSDWETRHHTLLNTLNDALITIDRQGYVKTFNQAAETIFGYSAEEVIGKKINMLMPEPHSIEHDKYISRYINTGHKHIIGTDREVMAQRKNGALFPIELALSEMRLEGELQFTGLIKDITERKKMERLKNEFISTVSHELRTPLTSIRGALGLINSSISGNLPEKLLGLLEIASNNTERLLLLINDILDIEKIESGNLRFDFRRVDLYKVVYNAINDCQGYAHEHFVVFKLNASAEPAILINADPDRITQVINNLLSNAAKFSPDHSVVDVSLTEQQGFARISVRDYGMGIPKSFLPRLFDKFSQVDGTDKRIKGGTGLGLSIAKAIIEKHQGKISVETAENVGTTFYVDLPIYSVSEIDSSYTSSRHPELKVLIIEDDQQPDLVGKVMIFQYGKTIKDKIQAEKNGEISGVSCNVFDLSAGKDFVLSVKEIQTGDETYPDYKNSAFKPETTSLPVYIDGKGFKNVPLVNGKIDPKAQQMVKEFLLKRDHELEEFAPKRLTEEQQAKINEITAYLTGKASANFKK